MACRPPSGSSARLHQSARLRPRRRIISLPTRYQPINSAPRANTNTSARFCIDGMAIAYPGGRSSELLSCGVPSRCCARAFSKHERHNCTSVRTPRSAKTRRPQLRQRYSRLGNEPPHQGALPGVLQLLRPVREVGDERLEVELRIPTTSMQSYTLSLQLRIDRLAILLGGEEPEGGPPAQLRLPVACRHRHLDVVGVDRVLLGKMPRLQSKGIGADAGRDPAVHPDRAPGATHALLPRFPFLPRFQWAHIPPDSYASPVPSVQPAAEGELLAGAVEAGLVVDLIGRQVGDDILYAPAAAMAAR